MAARIHHRGPITYKPSGKQPKGFQHSKNLIKTHHVFPFTKEAFDHFYSMPDQDKWLINAMESLCDFTDVYITQREVKHLENLNQVSSSVMAEDPSQNTACLLWEKQPEKRGGGGHFMLLWHKQGDSHCILFDSYGRRREGQSELDENWYSANVTKKYNVSPETGLNWTQPDIGLCWQDIQSSSCGAWVLFFFMTRCMKTSRPQHIRPLQYSGEEEVLFNKVKNSKVDRIQLMANEVALWKYMKKNLLMWAVKDAADILHESDRNYGKGIFRDGPELDDD